MGYTGIAAARDDILALFKATWDASGLDSNGQPVKAVYDDTAEERPEQGQPWVRLMVKHTTGGQATVGGRPGQKRFRRFGILTVQVFTPFGQGLTLSDTLVNVVLGIFEGQQASLDGAFFYNCRPQEIGQSDDWHQTNVVVEFQWDQIR